MRVAPRPEWTSSSSDDYGTAPQLSILLNDGRGGFLDAQDLGDNTGTFVLGSIGQSAGQ